MKGTLKRLNGLVRKHASLSASIALNAAVIGLLCLCKFQADSRGPSTVTLSMGSVLSEESGEGGTEDSGFPDLAQPGGYPVTAQPVTSLVPQRAAPIFAATERMATARSMATGGAGLPSLGGDISGGNGTGRGGGGGRIGRLVIQARHLGVILDISGSMSDDAERVSETIAQQFNNALCVKVVGCEITAESVAAPVEEEELPFNFGQPMRGKWQTESAWPEPKSAKKTKKDWPWRSHSSSEAVAAQQGTHMETSETILAIALLASKGVDAVYWFCDLQDLQTNEGLHALDQILRTHRIRFYVQSQELDLAPKLKEIVLRSGGAYSVEY